MAVQKAYVNQVRDLTEKSTDQLILHHLLKAEQDNISQIVHEKYRREKNYLEKAFYAEFVE